jgi:hypothetical protein
MTELRDLDRDSFGLIWHRHQAILVVQAKLDKPSPPLEHKRKKVMSEESTEDGNGGPVKHFLTTALDHRAVMFRNVPRLNEVTDGISYQGGN